MKPISFFSLSTMKQKKILKKVNELSSKDMKKIMKLKYPIKISAKNTVPIDQEEEMERNKEVNRILTEGKTLYAHGTIEEFEYDPLHKKGKCIHSVVAMCSAEEQRIQMFMDRKKTRLLEAIQRLPAEDANNWDIESLIYIGKYMKLEDVIKLINKIL